MSIKHCAYCGEETRSLEGNGALGGHDSLPLDPDNTEDAKMMAVLELGREDVDKGLIRPGIVVCYECYDMANDEVDWLA